MIIIGSIVIIIIIIIIIMNMIMIIIISSSSSSIIIIIIIIIIMISNSSSSSSSSSSSMLECIQIVCRLFVYLLIYLFRKTEKKDLPGGTAGSTERATSVNMKKDRQSEGRQSGRARDARRTNEIGTPDPN